jgi:hypothetical protein
MLIIKFVMAGRRKTVFTERSDQGKSQKYKLARVDNNGLEILDTKESYHVAYSRYISYNGYSILTEDSSFDQEYIKDCYLFVLEIRAGAEKDLSKINKNNRNLRFIKCIGYENVKIPLFSIKAKIYCTISKESFLYLISIKENRSIYALICAYCFSDVVLSVNKYSKYIANDQICNIIDRTYDVVKDKTIFFGDIKRVKDLNEFIKSITFAINNNIVKVISLILYKCKEVSIEWSNGYYFGSR